MSPQIFFYNFIFEHAGVAGPKFVFLRKGLDYELPFLPNWQARTFEKISKTKLHQIPFHKLKSWLIGTSKDDSLRRRCLYSSVTQTYVCSPCCVYLVLPFRIADCKQFSLRGHSRAINTCILKRWEQEEMRAKVCLHRNPQSARCLPSASHRQCCRLHFSKISRLVFVFTFVFVAYVLP